MRTRSISRKSQSLKGVGVVLLAAALVVGVMGCPADPEPDPDPAQYSLTISSSEGGVVTAPGEDTFTYEEGAVASLVAEAEDGYRFVNWTGDVETVADTDAAETTVTMNGDYSISAYFVAQYVLTIEATDGGEVTTPGEGTFRYDAGAEVYLVATPARGFRFVNWTGDVAGIADSEAATTSIIIGGDYSITASFEEEEVVHFADANLAAAVREAIDVLEGPIYPEDFEWLDELDARERNIQDLTGLEHCTFLISLHAGSNEIGDISPLANLTRLMFLHLDSNQISDISPLANLTYLGWLNLQDNEISDISALEGLTNLSSLRLHRNQISDISPLANLTNLNTLVLDSNQISDVSALAGLTKLRGVGLMNNQISDISPLASLTGLTELDLGWNQISDISALANLTSLQRLFLEVNEISDISALANLTSLTYLKLRSNQISDISPLVENEGFSEGDQVDLRENPLGQDSINTYIPELQARGVTVDY